MLQRDSASSNAQLPQLPFFRIFLTLFALLVSPPSFSQERYDVPFDLCTAYNDKQFAGIAWWFGHLEELIGPLATPAELAPLDKKNREVQKLNATTALDPTGDRLQADRIRTMLEADPLFPVWHVRKELADFRIHFDRVLNRKDDDKYTVVTYPDDPEAEKLNRAAALVSYLSGFQTSQEVLLNSPSAKNIAPIQRQEILVSSSAIASGLGGFIRCKLAIMKGLRPEPE